LDVKDQIYDPVAFFPPHEKESLYPLDRTTGEPRSQMHILEKEKSLPSPEVEL
jgi:hypothetical protein